MVSPDNINAPPKKRSSMLSEGDMTLRRLLKSSPQDLWLDTLRRTQGPQHNNLVYWMLNQIECDFAIAVHAFYHSNPARHLDNPRPLPARPGPSDIFALVLLNWDTGSYRTHRLKVEPTDASPRAIAQINQKVMARPRGSLPFRIPKAFLDPQGGTLLNVPAHMSPDDAVHLRQLYASMGLAIDSTPPGISRRLARAKSVLTRLKRA